MTRYFVSNNRAGYPSVTDGLGCFDSYATHELAAAECARRNAVALRIAEKRAAREIAQGKLGALAKRLRVGLAILPEILPSSTSLAHMRECVRG